MAWRRRGLCKQNSRPFAVLGGGETDEPISHTGASFEKLMGMASQIETFTGVWRAGRLWRLGSASLSPECNFNLPTTTCDSPLQIHRHFRRPSIVSFTNTIYLIPPFLVDTSHSLGGNK